MTLCGRLRQARLERRRWKTLSDIRWHQLAFETMIQRAQAAGDTPSDAFVQDVRGRLADIEQRANRETNIDELHELVEDAEQQGQLRAYVCPAAEIRDEGNLSIDLMEEWNVPKAVISKLRSSFSAKLDKSDTAPDLARSALRAIFEERDSWSRYTEDYEETMRHFTYWLLGGTVVLPILAVFAFRHPPLCLAGLLFAGAAGSCVSVMAKMPVLDVRFSGELEAYHRRILTRIGVGIGASLIGCALLGWGLLPISIQDQTFAGVLDACTAALAASCTNIKTLILLGVPMVFGFSERALTSFELRVFGS